MTRHGTSNDVKRIRERSNIAPKLSPIARAGLSAAFSPSRISHLFPQASSCSTDTDSLLKMIETEEISQDSTVTRPADLEFATLEKQRARAFLRERFLRVITGIVGKKKLYACLLVVVALESLSRH